MNTDPIADLLTRIRNAQKAGHPTVVVPASKTKEQILNVLQEEGYIERIVDEKDGAKKFYRVFLRYDSYGAPVIKEVRRLSKSGRRQYVTVEKIPFYRSGLGTIVVSTSKGMMTGQEAKRQHVGGELICAIF